MEESVKPLKILTLNFSKKKKGNGAKQNSDDETNCTIGIVSRNLATQSNFVGFQDSWNFTYFETTDGCRGTHGEPYG